MQNVTDFLQLSKHTKCERFFASVWTTCKMWQIFCSCLNTQNVRDFLHLSKQHAKCERFSKTVWTTHKMLEIQSLVAYLRVLIMMVIKVFTKPTNRVHRDCSKYIHTHTHTHTVTHKSTLNPAALGHCACSLRIKGRVECLTEKPEAMLMRVWVPGAARDFSPRVNFQYRLSYGVRTAPQTLAGIPVSGHENTAHS